MRATSPATARAGGIAGAGAPPFRLPGEHFAAALAFLVLGAVGLVVLAGEIAGGAYPSLRVIALTHFFTLGWITTSIMGALYQLMPSVLGRPVRSVGLAHVSFGLHAIGLPLFAGSLLAGRLAPMVAGAVTMAAGLVLFLANLWATLAAACRRRDLTWWALLGASVFLAFTLVAGVVLAGNLRWGYLGAERFLALGVHLHVALGGWVLLVMVGVAHRLLPMFLLSHGVGDRLMRAAAALVAGGAGTLMLGHHGPPLLARWLPAVLLASGLVCFLAQAALLYRRRLRRALDPGLRLAALALGMLGVGLALGGPVVLGAGDARLATAYILAVIGGMSLFVAGHYYKIVPFLVWHHRFAGRGAGARAGSSVAELLDTGRAKRATSLLVLGVAGLAAGVLLGQAAVVRLAALAFAAGTALVAGQMLGLARRRPA